MAPNTGLSQRQRAAIPIDKWHARRGPSAGGYDTTHPLTLARGMDDDLARYPGTSQDGAVVRDKSPFYHAETRSPVGEGWHDWTADGPPRAELHMRTSTYRREQGGTRYPFIPGSPTGGRHTMVPSATTYTTPRYVDSGLPQMRAARVNRLAAARYSGQSYSQTTAVQGRAVRR